MDRAGVWNEHRLSFQEMCFPVFIFSLISHVTLGKPPNLSKKKVFLLDEKRAFHSAKSLDLWSSQQFIPG